MAPAIPSSKYRGATSGARSVFLDFIEAENSMGFHADQEAMRVLAMSIDETRRGQAALPGSPATARAQAPPAPLELVSPDEAVGVPDAR